MSNAQQKMWQAIRDQQLNGYRFIRDVLIEPFIVDFACVEHKIIVEVDPAPNSEHLHLQRYRTDYLQNKGFKVLRFLGNEVNADMAKVLWRLNQQL